MICTNCKDGELEFRSATIRTEIGQLKVDDGSAMVHVCRKCGHQDLTSEEWAHFELRAAAFVLNADLRKVTGEVLRDVRKALGLRQKEMAGYLNRDVKTLSDYERNVKDIPQEIKLAAAALVERVCKHGREALDLEKAPSDSGEFRLTG